MGARLSSKPFLNCDERTPLNPSALEQEEDQNSLASLEFGVRLKPYLKTLNQPPPQRSYEMQAFFSSLNLVSDLTDISVQILRSENKMTFLQKALIDINKNLPAATYLPILQKSLRNYSVLNILEKESRLFITAEKAPYLICIEVFQPLELELEVNQHQAKFRPRAFEILSRLNIINKDSHKLLQKLDF